MLKRQTIIFSAVTAIALFGAICTHMHYSAEPDAPPVQAGGMSVPPVELPDTNGKPDYAGPPRNLEEARERVRQRLKVLDAMTSDEWFKEQMEHQKRVDKLVADEKERMRALANPTKRFPDLSGGN